VCAYVGALPMFYMLNGKQYVAVATGTGTNGGGAIVVFALPQ
jgi:glucose dehydrogenase